MGKTRICYNHSYESTMKLMEQSSNELGAFIYSMIFRIIPRLGRTRDENLERCPTSAISPRSMFLTGSAAWDEIKGVYSKDFYKAISGCECLTPGLLAGISYTNEQHLS